jgi:hypothetical protein
MSDQADYNVAILTLRARVADAIAEAETHGVIVQSIHAERYVSVSCNGHSPFGPVSFSGKLCSKTEKQSVTFGE